MPWQLKHRKGFAARLYLRIPANAPCIHSVRLFQTVGYAGVFGNVTVGGFYITELTLSPVIHFPTHNTHQGCVPKGLAPLDFELDFSAMVSFVASLAEGDKVIRSITAGLTGLNVMNIEDGVL